MGSFWLVAAFWLDSGWSEDTFWAGLLPAVWLLTLPILMGRGGPRSGG